MIRNDKVLITDWDALYMAFNKEFDVDVFECACADEYPLMGLLDEMKNDKDAFENIVEFFYDNYVCVWFNNKTGQFEEIEGDSPEYFEALEQHRLKIMSIANYFKSRRNEDLLDAVIKITSRINMDQCRIKITPSNVLEN